jgi:hypothetical protein
MISTAVTSSLISTVDFDGDLKLLTVHFHGGKRVAIAPFSAEEYVAFMSAESKGKHFHKYIAPRLKGEAGTASREQPAPTSIALKEPLPLGPLETFHHDDCCTKHLQKADRAGIQNWECPNCGTPWEKVQRGDIYNWEPRPSFFLVRVRRG